MTDTAIIAVGTAIATIIASLTAAVVAIAALRKTTASGAAAAKSAEATQITAEATLRKTDTIIEKAVEIHTLTNSRMSKVTADLEVALSKITGLETRIAAMAKDKATAEHVAERLAETRPTEPKR